MACLAGAGVSGYYAIPRPKVSPPAPGLHAESQTYDVGERGQGETVPIDFKLTNNYSQPVEIHSVTAGCSCLTPTVSHKHLAPGQEAVVSLKWDTGTRRGKAAESVWVLHSIPGKPPEVGGRMQLTIEGTVVPDIRRDPERVQFTLGQAGKVEVRLSPGRLADFQIREVYANSAALSTRYLSDASTVEITYTPKSELDAGSGLHVIVVTSSQVEPKMYIPVSVVRP